MSDNGFSHAPGEESSEGTVVVALPFPARQRSSRAQCDAELGTLMDKEWPAIIGRCGILDCQLRYFVKMFVEWVFAKYPKGSYFLLMTRPVDAGMASDDGGAEYSMKTAKYLDRFVYYLMSDMCTAAGRCFRGDCSGRGECQRKPYSREVFCSCDFGYEGETCQYVSR